MTDAVDDKGIEHVGLRDDRLGARAGMGDHLATIGSLKIEISPPS